MENPEESDNYSDKSEQETPELESEDEPAGSDSDDDPSYMTTRRGTIKSNKNKAERKADRLNGEYSHRNQIQQRVIGPPCMDCKLECDKRIAERFRLDNYLNFWGKLKTWEERREFVRRLVVVLRIPHPTKEIRKKFLRKYYLELEGGLTIVCKTMFFNTLAISNKFIETTLIKCPDNVLDESKVTLINSPTNKSTESENSPKKVKRVKLELDKEKNEEQEEQASFKEEIPKECEFLDEQNKKEMRPPCACFSNCAGKLAQETRLKIYEHFWNKLDSWFERKLFILSTCETDKFTSIRTFVLPVQDGDVTAVCQEMYFNTISVSEQDVNPLLPKVDPKVEIKKRKYGDYSDIISEQLNFMKNQPQIVNFNNISQLLPKAMTKDLQIQPIPLIKKAKLEYTPLKPPCSCAAKCRLQVTEHIRQEIHKEFWNLPAQVDKKSFILSTIQTHENGIHGGYNHEIKCFTLPIDYDSVVVCKEMYLNTLTVSEQFVVSTIKNINQDGSIIEEDDNNWTPPTQIRQIPIQRPHMRNGISEAAKMRDTALKTLHEQRTYRKAKVMGPPCPSGCRHQCSTKFTEEERKELHDKFWGTMDWQARKQFVKNSVEEFPIRNRSVPNEVAKRNFTRIYTLPNRENKIIVCQKMYFNTLSIGSKFVSTVHIWASQVKW